MELVLTYFAIIILLIIACYGVIREKRISQKTINNEKLILERESIQNDLDRLSLLKKNAAEEIDSLKQLYDSNLELYDSNMEKHVKALQEKLTEIQTEIENKKAELESIKNTKRATIEAAKREEQVAKEPEKYGISFEPDELHDISYVNSIKSKLIHPEILGKYIWSAFIQKKFKTFTLLTLGKDKVCGVYKITDQITQEVYIGQSVDVAKRWSDHIKSGIGATPTGSGNLLYSAINRDGVENFTFELLETCTPEQLNEKEKYFINIYSSDSVGLNSKQGNQNKE